ncbi:hypothetical protein FAM09_07060 [Niastella caeni]|uniref:Uncharacterized protein n=1 Tax=Niastella caeni TaxID=2569763 RepID=A0A4S8I146_9BACT|nr:hypothetical protein [Niastella caeni]THU41853.1 hypothetical protein FAM09_07060 [Niastella caeni]
MKTIVLMGMSCLVLAGVYGVMIKKSEVSKLLSFTQANNTASPLGSENVEKTTSRSIADSNSTSNTLDDSHWIEDPLFEKAAASDLLTENEPAETTVPQQEIAPETIKQNAPGKGVEEPVTVPIPEIKQLILELNPDTTVKRKVPVDVV